MDTWVLWVDRATLLIPLLLAGGCIAILLKRNLRYGYQRVVFGYLLLALLFDLATRWWTVYYSNNLLFVVCYGAVELLLISVLYVRYFLRRYRIIAAILTSLGLIFIAGEASLTGQVMPQDMATYQTYARSVVSFIIVVQGMLFAMESLADRRDMRNALLLLNPPIVCYYALNFVFYLPINFFITASTDLRFALWVLNVLLLLFFYVYLIVHLWRFGSDRRPSSYG